jgi:hypothetical protein
VTCQPNFLDHYLIQKGFTNRYVWSDFGGKREGSHETAEDTACREFSEETLGLWGGMGDLQTRVANSIANIKSKVLGALCGNGCFVLKNGLYVNFVVPVEVPVRQLALLFLV